MKNLAKKALDVQFIRFLLTGILNTLFGYAVFVTLIWLGLHYPLAILVSTLLGALFNFKTIGTFVFTSRDNSLIWRFLIVYGTVYIINVLALRFLRAAIPNDYLSQAILLPIVALVSYFFIKRFVYIKSLEK